MIDFHNYVDALRLALEKTEVTDNQLNSIETEDGLVHWLKMTRKLQISNQTLYFVGNGASAMMASHMAADASKNGNFRSLAFNDVALMTAVSNDIAYEECFAVPLNRFANKGDGLVTISSSGNSTNIIRAIETARDIDMGVITLSGMDPNNKSRKMGDINFYIPAHTYGIVEVNHQALLHCWLDRFMEISS
jgi:D-sedoheptulose 7-phosphate isomerase